MYHYCALIFSTHNPFSGFWNMNSVKIWTYRGKFLYYVPIFSSVRTYTKKIFVMSHVNVIIGHFYHLYVYMSHLTVSEGLFCYRFVYMSHASATAGHFFTLLSICPTFLIHWDIFRPLSFIYPIGFFHQVFI